MDNEKRLEKKFSEFSDNPLNQDKGYYFFDIFLKKAINVFLYKKMNIDHL